MELSEASQTLIDKLISATIDLSVMASNGCGIANELAAQKTAIAEMQSHMLRMEQQLLCRLDAPPLDIAAYRLAPSGDGPLANTWRDKPHRLVYDLCTAIENNAFDCSSLSREACIEVGERASARLKQLRTEDPFAYAVKRKFRGETRYKTNVPGQSWQQMHATDWKHSELWLTSSQQRAEEMCTALEKRALADATYSVVKIPKATVRELPCAYMYRGMEDLGNDNSTG